MVANFTFYLLKSNSGYIPIISPKRDSIEYIVFGLKIINPKNIEKNFEEIGLHFYIFQPIS